MQFGCCANINLSETIHAAGFDYLDASITSLLPDADDAVFALVFAHYRASPIPIQAFNLFLPRNLKIMGQR